MIANARTPQPHESESERDRVTEVAPGELSPEALRGIAEEFVTRESTDYGASEKGFEEKVDEVMRQLRDGSAKIVFDPENATIQLQPAVSD
jgi:uncharacterized protein YheU (UPF0270 family)